MNIKNKFLLGLCLISLISIMCGCGLSINHDRNEYSNNENSEKPNMYNDNDKIVKEDNKYTYETRGNNGKNNKIEIKYSGFSGIDTICFFRSKRKH